MSADAPHKICMIFNIQGFHLSGKFYVREMGVSAITQEFCTSASFNLQFIPLPSEADGKDRQTYWFLKNIRDGLNLHPKQGEPTYAYHYLDHVVKYYYDIAKWVDGDVVGVKGGHVEKNFLRPLNIPFQNIEEYGCPKIEDLPLPTVEGCGFHDHTVSEFKCPRQKAWVYAKWFREKFYSTYPSI